MHITHEMHKSDLKCQLDLKYIAMKCRDAIAEDTPFRLVKWRHRKIGCLAYVYHTGVILCHGNKHQTRRYLRLIRKLGYSVPRHHTIQLVTSSAMHTLSHPVNYIKLHKSMANVSYEAEIYHAPILKRENISFTVYSTGKIIMAGIKSEDDINDIVMPTLLEIDICS
jgi:TATA-box binding protein (TBP) (component of TFIID and TFIIIB)